jgi:bifunctional DNA-binding transcriptional regulator/antitoxin component of YhaV-PrlF toxin-antitoxin module
VSRVTSKLQVTLPKALASRYGIEPGDEIEWEAAGEVIRVVPIRAAMPEATAEARLRLFDSASRRQRHREVMRPRRGGGAATDPKRGWTRDELYDRGRSR